MNSQKYQMSVSITKVGGGTPLYDDNCRLDEVISKLPEGGFDIEVKHENPKGFAKIMQIVDSSKLGDACEVLTRFDWRKGSLTGEGIPEIVKLRFVNKESAICFLFVAMIPTVVDGKWRIADFTKQTAFSRFLSYITASGAAMFFTTGLHCGGRVFPLSKPSGKDKVITTVLDARQALASKLPVKVKITSAKVVKATDDKPKPSSKLGKKAEHDRDRLAEAIKQQVDNDQKVGAH